MTYRSYRAAKRWDAGIQVAVLCLVILYGLILRSGYRLLFGFYFGVGAAQFTSWLCWILATPRATFHSGRGRYSIALITLLALVGIDVLTKSFGLSLFLGLFATPFVAIAYFATTINESKVYVVDERQELQPSFFDS